jgi:hypothetical protein
MSKMILDTEFKYEDNKLYRIDKRTKKWNCCNDKKPNQGYIQIGVNSKLLLLHRLVYKYHNMDWDMTNTTRDNSIDHVNHNKTDNRIENLRAVNNSQNKQNSTHYGGKKIRGGHFCKNRNTWVAEWRVNGKPKSKSFKTELEALEYRKEMVAKHYTHAPDHNLKAVK